METIKFKFKTSANDNAVHRVFKTRFGFYAHIVSVLTEDKNGYGNKFHIVRKFRGKYLIQSEEVYQKETWEAIVQAINYLEMDKKLTIKGRKV